jgi:LCP family protein required for cell wall assembly
VKAWLARLLLASVLLAAQVSGAAYALNSESSLGLTPQASPLEPGILQILLMGTDRRPPAGGWRTDTMILVSIDVDRQTVGMVSIPRDLFVAIPGHGKSRINMADNFGEADHYPGGGPALLRKMLEENLGLTFDRYVRIDFQGFADVVDLLGGIDVDVRCRTELWVPNMKVPGEYTLWRVFDPGMHHMDGELALMYSRCRAHTPVFDRDRRQREVLLALRNRMLELGVPGLLPKLSQLLENMNLHVQTDLAPAEIVALAQLATRLPPQNVTQKIIDLSVAPQWPTPDGAWVMRPDRPAVKELTVDRVRQPSSEAQTLAAEGLRVAVENGTTIEGFGLQMADRLRSQGYHVVEVAKADSLDHEETRIISYVGPGYTLDRLRQYLGVGEDRVDYEASWLTDVAIRVVLGRDAQPSCPS